MQRIVSEKGYFFACTRYLRDCFTEEDVYTATIYQTPCAADIGTDGSRRIIAKSVMPNVCDAAYTSNLYDTENKAISDAKRKMADFENHKEI